MNTVIAVLMKVAVVGILLLTIGAVIAVPFVIRSAIRHNRKMDQDMAEFEARHKQRMADLRRPHA